MADKLAKKNKNHLSVCFLAFWVSLSHFISSLLNQSTFSHPLFISVALLCHCSTFLYLLDCGKFRVILRRLKLFKFTEQNFKPVISHLNYFTFIFFNNLKIADSSDKQRCDMVTLLRILQFSSFTSVLQSFRVIVLTQWQNHKQIKYNYPFYREIKRSSRRQGTSIRATLSFHPLALWQRKEKNCRNKSALSSSRHGLMQDSLKMRVLNKYRRNDTRYHFASFSSSKAQHEKTTVTWTS